ncbi:hypothetical protein B0H14DRAFT_3433566 [Mycena olivaceomarginata]|nr:hypothetical protein B0H14DRAFT_3433566 [Mycena olivaceomarginata]
MQCATSLCFNTTAICIDNAKNSAVKVLMFRIVTQNCNVGSYLPGETIRMYPALRNPLLKLLQQRYGYKDGDFERDPSTGDSIPGSLILTSCTTPPSLRSILCLARGVTWETRLETPRVCWVNRYDWGYHCANDFRAARLWGQVDPGAGWLAALERYKRLSAVNKFPSEGHPDEEKWTRLHGYASHNIFLVDAADGAVVKLMARSVSHSKRC